MLSSTFLLKRELFLCEIKRTRGKKRSVSLANCTIRQRKIPSLLTSCIAIAIPKKMTLHCRRQRRDFPNCPVLRWALAFRGKSPHASEIGRRRSQWTHTVRRAHRLAAAFALAMTVQGDDPTAESDFAALIPSLLPIREF